MYLVASKVLVSTCDYEYHIGSVGFKCLELVHNRNVTRCMFHDINYLKGDNYEKHKEEVANRFNRKLSKYRSNNMPLKFIGYCLPDTGYKFLNMKFNESVYFNKATFYGVANFHNATFSKGANFSEAIFANTAVFSEATFSEEGVSFYGAKFAKICSFNKAIFSGEAVFIGESIFSSVADFNRAMFIKKSRLNKIYYPIKHTLIQLHSTKKHTLIKLYS